MFVQRLLRWLAALRARLSSRPADIPAREVVHAGQARAAAHGQSYRPSGGLASARWLDDARRLRPVRHRPADSGERARPSARPSAGGGEPRRERESVSRPRPTPPLERAVKPAQPSQPSQPIAPAAAMPAPPHQSPAQRELLALRHLVRLGIYNEGFTNGAAPDQYHHSLGLDGSGDEDISAQ